MAAGQAGSERGSHLAGVAKGREEAAALEMPLAWGKEQWPWVDSALSYANLSPVVQGRKKKALKFCVVSLSLFFFPLLKYSDYYLAVGVVFLILVLASCEISPAVLSHIRLSSEMSS